MFSHPQVLQKIVFSKGSIVNLIKNSDFIKVWHQRNVGKIQHHIVDATRSAHLGFSKHRFDSTQRPLGRCILEFEALVLTAQQVAESRRGSKEADSAIDFLRFLTPERLLLLAMASDAGDELYEFVLTLDKEDVENELLARHCSEFLERIALLFGPTRQYFKPWQKHKPISSNNIKQQNCCSQLC